MFDKQEWSPWLDLRYHVADDFLRVHDGTIVGNDVESSILLTKIYFSGLLADEIEKEFGWCMKNRKALLVFRQEKDPEHVEAVQKV